MELETKKRKLISAQTSREGILKYFGSNVQTSATPLSASPHSATEMVDKEAENPGGGGVVDENNNSKAPVKSHWQDKWQNTYGNWLSYDKEKNMMYCTLCKEHKFKNAMALGTSNFKTTTIDRHLISNDHKTALSFPKAKQNLDTAIGKAETKEEKSIMLCMKPVYFLAVEGIPLSKYSKFLVLLKQLENPNLEALKVGENIDYSSYTSACDLLHALSKAVDKNVTEKLKSSPVITIMTDESTDITVHHKLVISARIVDPVSLSPSTHFLTDLRITSASGKGIFNAIKGHLDSRFIDIAKVTGLGTDGASVMTGQKTGLTGQFLRHNPHLINTHCSAHRVALCSKQAATNIPAMKYYQGTLESLFYYFKKSPGRCDKIEAVQKVLNEPTLKYREVHQVRWLSFYQALDAVYRTLDSLISFFSTATDDKAKGFKKKLSDRFFVYMTYAMMDILQPIMKLNLFFQRKDVDIGLVQVSVDQCVKDLQAMLEQENSPFLQQLEVDLVGDLYKGQHLIHSPKYNEASTRTKFLEALIQNITKRFPDKQLMTSFCALGLRPITLLDDEEIQVWGNNSIETLVDHFGKEQVYTYIDPEDETKTVHTVKSPPMVNADQTFEEWTDLKKTVKVQMYPKKSTADIWNLITQYHSDSYPNLKKLAALALSHPVHTSDCERAFSAQNSVTTPLRNRISPDHCDQIMRLIIEGPEFNKFNYRAALKVWRSEKSRILFKRN